MNIDYHDGRGTLVLETVTPIIRALFACYNLGVDYSGNGKPCASLIPEPDGPDWDIVMHNLLGLAERRHIPLSTVQAPTIQTVLQDFAAFVGTRDHPKLKALIEHPCFEEVADLSDLFLIATCLDDGHGLTAVELDAYWQRRSADGCVFGGDSHFVSRLVNFSVETSCKLATAANVPEWLLNRDVDHAVTHLLNQVALLLAGNANPGARLKAREKVFDILGR